MEEPDPRTIRAAASGDTAAFGVLVRETQADVWRFLRHLVGDPDLTQETYLRVHRGLPKFRFGSKFSSWIFRIARNLATDEFRSQQRKERVTRLLRSSESVPVVDELDAVDVREALLALPPRLREPFVLVEVFGHSYADAAEIAGIPTGTAKSRVHHARRQLVEWLRADEEEGERELS